VKEHRGRNLPQTLGLEGEDFALGAVTPAITNIMTLLQGNLSKDTTLHRNGHKGLLLRAGVRQQGPTILLFSR